MKPILAFGLLLVTTCWSGHSLAAYCEGASGIACYEGVDRSGRSPETLYRFAQLALASATTSEQRDLAIRAMKDAFDPSLSDQRALYCNQRKGGFDDFQRCMRPSGPQPASNGGIIAGGIAALGGFFIVPFIAGVLFYFIPFIVGHSRSVQNRTLLFLVNLIFGWTVFGWFACLLWAVLAQDGVQRAVYRRMLSERSGK